MARRPLEREWFYLDGGRRTTQLMRDSLGGMPNHGMRFPEVRALATRESQLLAWLLEHGKPSALAYLGEIEGLRVVARCTCGCASIDFLEAPGALEILSDYKWRDADGHLFGAFAFAKEGKLAGLELWSIDGQATPNVLPDTAVLVPLDGHAA